MSDEYLIVTADIPFGAVYAYRVGDKISRDAVKANKWEDYVSAPSSATAKTAVAEAAGTTKEK